MCVFEMCMSAACSIKGVDYSSGSRQSCLCKGNHFLNLALAIDQRGHIVLFVQKEITLLLQNNYLIIP